MAMPLRSLLLLLAASAAAWQPMAIARRQTLLSSGHTSLLLSSVPRGGGLDDDQPRMVLQRPAEPKESTELASSASPPAPAPAADRSRQIKLAVGVATAVLASALAYAYRAPLSIIFDKDRLLAEAIRTLNKLNELPKVASYVSYASGFAVWEMLGLPTIPVETAAGMIFGWNGLWLSSAGKFLGCLISFTVARYGSLASWIQNKLADNSFLNLVKDSADASPVQTAFLMKCSCFPDPIKNYGTGVLKPVRLWMFALASAWHGSIFSFIWTYLGVDTAKRMAGAIPPDRRLQACISFALINGVAITPLLMAAWIRKLTKQSSTATTEADAKKES